MRQSDLRKVRSMAASTVLEKTSRILSSEDLRVKMTGVPNVQAPAFTDGETITINTDWEPVKESLSNGFTASSLMVATALNYHELAHCMFMPRLDSGLVTRIKNEHLFQSFNMLQDQADETRFVQLYEPARHYFTTLVTQFMRRNQSYIESNYVLVSGRLFLPKRFREEFRANYSKPEQLDEIDALVAEYKTLVSPYDDVRMLQVLREFERLIRGVTNVLHTPHSEIKKGAPDSSTARELSEQPEFEHEEDEDEEPEEAEGSSSEGDDQAEDGDHLAGGDQDGEEDGAEEDDELAEGSDGSDTPEELSPIEQRKSRDQRRRKLNEVGDEVEEEASAQIEEELERRVEHVRDEMSRFKLDMEPVHAPTEPPTPGLHRVVDRCYDAFREVQIQRGPSWHLSERVGKLNPRHYTRALKGEENVFKRWNEGLTNTLDFEIVLLLDTSTSMHARMRQASEAVWVLRRTFDELDGSVTTLSFSSKTRLLAPREEQADRGKVPQYTSEGLTFASDALNEADRIVSLSRRGVKLIAVVTDGGFSDREKALEVINQTKEPMAFIGIQEDTSQYEGCLPVIHTQTIDEPMELVDVVTNIAMRLSDAVANNRSYA